MGNDSIHRRLIKQIHELRRFDTAVMFGSITKSEFFVLDFLPKDGDDRSRVVYVSELARWLGIPPPGVSRMLRSMEAKGLIKREVEHSDRRNIRVLITQVGEATHSSAIKSMEKLTVRIDEQMGEEQITQLSDLLEKLSSITEEFEKQEMSGTDD